MNNDKLIQAKTTKKLKKHEKLIREIFDTQKKHTTYSFVTTDRIVKMIISNRIYNAQ